MRCREVQNVLYWRPRSVPDVQYGFQGASLPPPPSRPIQPLLAQREALFLKAIPRARAGAGSSALKLFLAALHSTQCVDVLPPVSHLPVFLGEWGQRSMCLSGLQPLKYPPPALQPAGCSVLDTHPRIWFWNTSCPPINSVQFAP